MFSGARTKTNDTKNSNQITSALNTKNLQILVTCKQIHIILMSETDADQYPISHDDYNETETIKHYILIQ